jgi:TonB family protein
LQGVVSLYVEVQNDGHPRNVQLMQGLGLGLDEKAVAAVEQWQFATKEGQPDATQNILDVDVEFRLDQPGVWDVASEACTVMVPSNPKIQKVLKPVPSRYVAPDAAACQTASRPIVRFRVGVDGMPRVVNGSLDAATHAVESWQFQPATVDGNPAEAEAEVELTCTPGGIRLKSVLEVPPVYRVGGGVTAPVLLSKIEPTYSEEARVARLQGSVLLYVQISPEGRATQMHVVQPLGMGFEEHAMEAVKRWRFQPGKKAGQPVTVEATIEVNFRLL